MPWTQNPTENSATSLQSEGFHASASPQHRSLPSPTCPKCGNVYMADAIFCRQCGQKREIGAAGAPLASAGNGCIRSISPQPQAPRVMQSIVVPTEPVTVRMAPSIAPIVAPAPFENFEKSGEGVRSCGAVRSVSPVPMRGGAVLAPGGPLQPRAMSPTRDMAHSRSPLRQRIVPLSASPVPAQAQIPVVRLPQAKPFLQARAVGAPQAAPQMATNAVSEDLLKRIDGVVSDMERELSDDLVACVKSPLGDLKGSQTSANGHTASGDESTVEWIDKQISAIENRREACEMRQAHLSDLRRLVHEGEQALGEDMSGTSNGRLSQLEEEHEQLKKQVESERQELLKVRGSLEMECERRLREVKSLAEAVEDGKQRAWAAEEAANQRAKEASLEVHALRERLREAEAAAEREREHFAAVQDAQAVAGADLKQLEENSRAVLGDCRVLQQRVRELETERTALLDEQVFAEEERRSLQAKILALEEEREAHAGAAVENMRATLHAEHHQQRKAQEEEHQQQLMAQAGEHQQQLKVAREQGSDEKHAAVLADLEKLQGDQQRLQADLQREAQARQEAERWHAAAVADTEILRADQEQLQADKAAEQQAKEQAMAAHRAALQDAEKLRNDQKELAQDRDAEKQARQEFERKHQAVLKDVEVMKADQQRAEKDKLAEQAARKQAEEKHAAVLQDVERVKADHARVQAEKEEEQRLRQAAEQKHAEVSQAMESLQADQRRLQADKEAEQQAKENLERAHKAVMDEKNTHAGNAGKLQELLEDERKAKAELERRHTITSGDKQKVERDHQELREAKASEERLRKEAEMKHQQLERDVQQLRADQAKLEADRKREQEAKEEAERKHQAVLQDMQQLQSDHKRLQADKEAEQRSKGELDAKHRAVLKDLESIQSDQRKLQMDKEVEARAKEEANRRHSSVVKDLEQVHADQLKLRADRDAEQQARLEVERKHQSVLQDMEKVRSDHRKLQADREAEERAKEDALTRHKEAVRRAESSEAELRALQVEHRQLRSERDKLLSEHTSTKQSLEEQSERTRASHVEELNVLKAKHLEELTRLKGVQQEESDRLKSYHAEAGKDVDRLTSDVQRLKAEKEAEWQAKNALQKQVEVLQEDIQKLRRSMAEKDSAETSLRAAIETETRQAKELTEELDDREKQVKNLKEKVNSLAAELEKEQRDGMQLREELQEMQLKGETLQRDAEDAMQKSDQLKAQIEITWREKVEQKDREIQALKESHAGDGLSTLQRLPTTRLSLWGEPTSLPRLSGDDDILQDLHDPFVGKVREAHRGLGTAMQNASEVHIKALNAQLEGVEAGINKGLGLRHGLHEYEHKHSIELERRTASSRLEARLHDLNAVNEEVDLEHQMSEASRQEVKDYLKADIVRCEEEIALFKLPSALSDEPDQLVEALLQLKASSSSQEFDDGLTPAHWAAKQGRRDILEFIRSEIVGGVEMLTLRDGSGRTPLFYAERSGRAGLAMWLQREGGATNAFKPTVQRPAVDKLSPMYKQVLEQIETRGWHTVKWKDDFTMLHWAAGKGHKDVCSYLIQLNADPAARDNQARTPADCARAAGHSEVMEFLEAAPLSSRVSISTSAFAASPIVRRIR